MAHIRITITGAETYTASNPQGELVISASGAGLDVTPPGGADITIANNFVLNPGDVVSVASGTGTGHIHLDNTPNDFNQGV